MGLRSSAYQCARSTFAEQSVRWSRCLALAQLCVKSASVPRASANQRGPKAALADGLRSGEEVVLRQPLQYREEHLALTLRHDPHRLEQHNHIVDVAKSRRQTVSGRRWFAARPGDGPQIMQQIARSRHS